MMEKLVMMELLYTEGDVHHQLNAQFAELVTATEDDASALWEEFDFVENSNSHS